MPPIVAFALAALIALPPAGPEATPAPLPASPEPSGRRLETRPASFAEDAIRRAAASPAPDPTFPADGPGRTITPTPITVSVKGSRPTSRRSPSSPRHPRRYLPCINAGDLPRLFALSTEQAERDNVVFVFSPFVTQSLAGGTPPAALKAEIVGGTAVSSRPLRRCCR